MGTSTHLLAIVQVVSENKSQALNWPASCEDVASPKDKCAATLVIKKGGACNITTKRTSQRSTLFSSPASNLSSADCALDVHLNLVQLMR